MRTSLDKQDFKIISLLIVGLDNKAISDQIKIPLSTVQRRVRNILQSGMVQTKIMPNFKRLGIKKGLIHVYLSDGDIKSRALDVTKMEGFLSSSVHVGNSDIVAEFVYEDSEQLIEAISNIKHMEGVERVVWSEEVYTLPVEHDRILKSFEMILSRKNNNNKQY